MHATSFAPTGLCSPAAQPAALCSCFRVANALAPFLTDAVVAHQPALQIGLHPVRGGNGGVQHISLAGGEAAQANLQEAAPLGRMLAPVGADKASILAAVEALEAEPTVGGGRERALGDTLRAVLRWIALDAPAAAAEGAAGGSLQRQPSGDSEEQAAEGPAGGLGAAQGFPGMRLLLFLAGPPNVGAGAVVGRRPSAAELAAAERAAAEQAEQAARELAALALDPQAGLLRCALHPEDSWLPLNASHMACADLTVAAPSSSPPPSPTPPPPPSPSPLPLAPCSTQSCLHGVNLRRAPPQRRSRGRRPRRKPQRATSPTPPHQGCGARSWRCTQRPGSSMQRRARRPQRWA